MSEDGAARPVVVQRWVVRRPRWADPEWEDVAPPAVGSRVDGYRLETRLGEGGQGTVYRARRGGRWFALKFLALTRNDWAWRELEVGLRLRRGRSLRVLGHGLWPLQKPRFVFLVMPYVRGRPLYDWARAHNPPAREAAHLMREVARQVADAHRAGVVHRDIKGANVLVRRTDTQPVLVDFGVGTYEGAPPITPPLAMPGTPHYRSPETLRFRREHGGEHSPARASDDLWALGVMFYVLLTGSHPFEPLDPRADEGTLADLILKQPPEPPHERNPRVPRALSELCLRMLEKSREARLPDAVAVCSALEEALAEADSTWDEPLCEAWSPDEATTPQEEGLDLGDWLDKARRLKLYARLRPTRGRPIPLAEASTLSRTPEAPLPPGGGEAPEAASPVPPAASPPGNAAARTVLKLSLIGLLVLPQSLSGPDLEASSRTPEVGGGQEVASPSRAPDGVTSAVPPEAATPAPVASATLLKDSTRVKTSRQAAFPRMQPAKSKTVLGNMVKTCGAALTMGQVACATPTQVQPSSGALPPPAECPAGAVANMKARGLGLGANDYVSFPHTGSAKIVTVQQGDPLTLSHPWGEIPPHTVFTGELFFGAKRVYGRFTQAHPPGGPAYAVCFELYDGEVKSQRGVELEPGSEPGAAKILSTVYLTAVDHFE